MPGLVVVNGAKITCDQLASCVQQTLVVTAGFMGPQAVGQPVATINDHVSGKNINPFPEICLTTGQPCNPETPDPWTPGEFAALIVSSVPIIAKSAQLKCTTGCGKIMIVDSGQSMFAIYPPSALNQKQEKDNPFFSIVGPVLPFAGMVAAVDGPLPIGDAIGGVALGGAAAIGGTLWVASRASSSDSDEIDDDDLNLHDSNKQQSNKGKHQRGRARKIRDIKRAQQDSQKGAKGGNRKKTTQRGRKNKRKQQREAQQNRNDSE